MKTPKRIQPLVDDGLVDEVISRLMSGKEADIYVVRCGDRVQCAKVYKEAAKRGFKQAVHYQEGRKVRSTRRARAMEKGSKFGRDQQEKVWQTAEVDALRRLADAGVRVPRPYDMLEGVLLMELITDDAGDVAPRLCDVVLTEEQALAVFFRPPGNVAEHAVKMAGRQTVLPSAGVSFVQVLMNLKYAATQRIMKILELRGVAAAGPGLEPLMNTTPAAAGHHDQMRDILLPQRVHRLLGHPGPVRDVHPVGFVHQAQSDVLRIAQLGGQT